MYNYLKYYSTRLMIILNCLYYYIYVFIADSQLLGVAVTIFYSIYPTRGILCVEHVRGSSCREFSPLPRRTRERGKG